MASRFAKFKKHTRRAKKQKRKQTRMKRMRGGSGPTVGSTGMPVQTYTFTVATPITPTSTATNFPSDLGTFTAGQQTISFTNPSKQILDIRIKNGTVAYSSRTSYGTSSQTKISISIGSMISRVPNGISLNGTTALPGASAATGLTGNVTIKGLGAGSFGTLPAILTFEVVAK